MNIEAGPLKQGRYIQEQTSTNLRKKWSKIEQSRAWSPHPYQKQTNKQKQQSCWTFQALSIMTRDLCSITTLGYSNYSSCQDSSYHKILPALLIYAADSLKATYLAHCISQKVTMFLSALLCGIASLRMAAFTLIQKVIHTSKFLVLCGIFFWNKAICVMFY